MLWAVQLLRQYLWRYRFTIRTDHEVLQLIFKISNVSKKLARKHLRFPELTLHITYRAGIEHQAAGALSRFPIARTNWAKLCKKVLVLNINTKTIPVAQNTDTRPEKKRQRTTALHKGASSHFQQGFLHWPMRTKSAKLTWKTRSGYLCLKRPETNISSQL